MRISLAASLLAMFFVWGCSGEPPRADTSGDHPSLGKSETLTPAAVEAEVDTGRLLVMGFESGYTVYDPDGRQVAHEPHRPGVPDEGPIGLKLAPGRYFVRMDGRVRGPREFWVTVERMKLTRVDVRPPDVPIPEVR